MKNTVLILLCLFSLSCYAQQEDKSSPKQESSATVSESKNDNAVYYLKVINKKAHTRVVYVDGQKQGEVKGLSERVFLVPVKYYRLVELEEKAITLSPKRESFITPNQPKDGDVVEIINASK